MLMMLGVAVDSGNGCRLCNAAVELPAADAHDAWWLSTLAMLRSICLPLMLMMLGLAVDTQYRGRAACRGCS